MVRVTHAHGAHVRGKHRSDAIETDACPPASLPLPQLSMTTWDIILLGVFWLHVVCAPYTKVEESFNIQATHDWLYLGVNRLAEFDHHTFPGVVPRTFLGSIGVSTLAYPAVRIFALLGFRSKLVGLYVVRLVLSSVTASAIIILRRAVRSAVGNLAAVFFSILCLSQFHLSFYAGRMLPNSYALILWTFAAERCVRGQVWDAARLLCICAAVFRSETVIILAIPLSVLLVVHPRKYLGAAYLELAKVSLGATLVSVSVDSQMWAGLTSKDSFARIRWPELEVFFFNSPAHNNGSEAWGVSPWHWYWSNALPRLLLGGYIFLPVGFLTLGVFRVLTSRREIGQGEGLQRRDLGHIVSPAVLSLMFVMCMSFLGHKETRFVLPAVPAFNIVCAHGLSILWENGLFVNGHEGHRRQPKRSRTKISKLLLCRVAIILILLMNCAVSALMLYASSHNYPGGVAMQLLHSKYCIRGDQQCSVHISNLPAMSGVSRFTEVEGQMKYSRNETLTADTVSTSPENFTHLVSEWESVPGFKVCDTVKGYGGISLSDLSKFRSFVRFLPSVRIHVRAGMHCP